MQIELPVGF